MTAQKHVKMTTERHQCMCLCAYNWCNNESLAGTKHIRCEELLTILNWMLCWLETERVSSYYGCLSNIFKQHMQSSVWVIVSPSVVIMKDQVHSIVRSERGFGHTHLSECESQADLCQGVPNISRVASHSQRVALVQSKCKGINSFRGSSQGTSCSTF